MHNRLAITLLHRSYTVHLQTIYTQGNLSRVLHPTELSLAPSIPPPHKYTPRQDVTTINDHDLRVFTVIYQPRPLRTGHTRARREFWDHRCETVITHAERKLSRLQAGLLVPLRTGEAISVQFVLQILSIEGSESYTLIIDRRIELDTETVRPGKGHSSAQQLQTVDAAFTTLASYSR